VGKPAVGEPSITRRIERFNKGREPERLALKYEALRAGPFPFLRGTCHLFYEDLPDLRLLRKAPLTWICGDLHLENIGTYEGGNGLVYFDVTDFEEAALAPCTLELVRAATSLLVAGKAAGLSAKAARRLGRSYLDEYARCLAAGKPLWIDRDAAQALVAKLFTSVAKRRRPQFIAGRTVLRKGRRVLDTKGDKALPASKAQREKVLAFMKKFIAAQDDLRAFRAVDVARRIAGTASLGVERYVILVQGRGDPRNYDLLDLKQALPSALGKRVKTRGPKWRSEAERVVCVQERMQAVPPAFLHSVAIGGESYVLKGLQPGADRIKLDDAKGDARLMESLATDFARLTAWDQLRASGRQGSAIADELIAFGSGRRWKKELLDVALDCAERNERSWEAFAAESNVA